MQSIEPSSRCCKGTPRTYPRNWFSQRTASGNVTCIAAFSSSATEQMCRPPETEQIHRCLEMGPSSGPELELAEPAGSAAVCRRTELSQPPTFPERDRCQKSGSEPARSGALLPRYAQSRGPVLSAREQKTGSNLPLGPDSRLRDELAKCAGYLADDRVSAPSYSIRKHTTSLRMTDRPSSLPEDFRFIDAISPKSCASSKSRRSRLRDCAGRVISGHPGKPRSLNEFLELGRREPVIRSMRGNCQAKACAKVGKPRILNDNKKQCKWA